MRIALAQVNPTVGDLGGNARLIVDWIDRAREVGADIVCFPELAITGYPPEDLVLKPSFVRDNLAQLDFVAHATDDGIAAVVGFVDQEGDIFNAAAFLHGGEVKAVYRKVFLPNYGVFDEKRYFEPGHLCPIVEMGGVRVAMSVCEDCWFPGGPMAWEAHHGAQVLININGSPYHYGKRAPREDMVAGRASDYGAFVAWVNTVGGQDELVFDGNSVVVDPSGKLVARAGSFVPELLVCDIDPDVPVHRSVEGLRREAEAAARLDLVVTELAVEHPSGAPAKHAVEQHIAKPLEGPAEIYAAVVLGTHDYIRKQGFRRVVIGLSGGVDSALTAAVACDALGPENVIGVRMPSRHTSPESLEDAAELAENLGMQLMDFSIEPPHRGFEEVLAPAFKGTQTGIAEENLQPRIRATILHALSNKFGFIVLSTGNKSEIATGYTTLYGDLAGGYAVLKDITKTMVYELCRYRNSLSRAIPERVITKAPSAELKPGQKDTDSLPPYSELDPILIGYIEEDLSPEELVATGHRPETVKRVIQLVDRSEYKRRQAPPGVKITPRAFGRDRRMPIINRYVPNGVAPDRRTP